MTPIRNGTRLLFALPSATTLHCSDAREACMSSTWNGAHSSSLYEQMEAETGVLSANAARIQRGIRVKVSDLPELWSSQGAIAHASLTLDAKWSYVGLDPVPANVEYPRLAFGFDHGAPSFQSAAWATSANLALDLFDAMCDDAGTRCCPYGSRECTAETVVWVERPSVGDFPPVRVEMQFSSRVEVDNCPLEVNEPKLELVEVTP